ncbi:Major facilitator superfamily domain, general substrate transporter [Moelleriella libera RCEF 2490]|uniref:Major facilitator superfamily domain, general substrate transporter n=1 Tax=Moelleriella libera RCEF 2490 TaxID=1081109 RepID=A0A168EI61_9HYPO|nr:Major facilitator superfamily domain, general substrate transporter [Moelleriella libera RCEF 2490]
MSVKDKDESQLADATTMELRSSMDASPLTEAEKARLLRKVDFRLLPMLFLIYVMAFLDRANIANALTLGMTEELGISGQQPNIALAVFFVPYIVFEFFSNFCLKRATPHVWLSLCILGFGIVMFCQGFIVNYAGLLTTRFFLGAFEAGIFPGSFYLISFWYRRQEAQKRFTVYFTSVIVASAFSGLLASAISKMNGVGGKSSWRWIFILEGILTMLVAVAAFFFVCDFPEQATWLSDRERHMILQKTGRLQKQQPSQDRVTMKDAWAFFRDPQHHFGALMYFCSTVPVYAFAYFTPTIVKTLGYSTVQTQLYSVPPYAAALAVCLVQAYLADRTDLRLPYLLFSGILLVSGLAILISTYGHFSVQYAGICLVSMGALSAAPLVICWYLMNLDGHRQRSMGSAWMISVGNVGGIVAPFAFLPQDAPRYHPGYSLCLAVAVLGMLTASGYALIVVRRRRNMRTNESQGEVDEAAGSGPLVPSL